MSDGPQLQTPLSLYPITIIETRYGGCYEGGKWAAFAETDPWDIPEEAIGQDPVCRDFWDANRSGIGVGESPDMAVVDLMTKRSVRGDAS